MVVQHFEMITKVYEISYLKKKNLKNYRYLPLKCHVGEAFLCSGGLVAQTKTPKEKKTKYFSFYMGHGIPRISLTDNERQIKE